MFFTRKSQASSTKRTVRARAAAASARAAARTGIRHARVWAAPRLERTGQTLEAQVAPKMAEMLTAVAVRIEPAPARPRRRWPVAAAALITAAGLGAAAAYLLKRRAAADAPEFPAPDDAASTTMSAEARGDPAASQANGRVRTG